LFNIAFLVFGMIIQFDEK